MFRSASAIPPVLGHVQQLPNHAEELRSARLGEQVEHEQRVYWRRCAEEQYSRWAQDPMYFPPVPDRQHTFPPIPRDLRNYVLGFIAYDIDLRRPSCVIIAVDMYASNGVKRERWLALTGG